MRNILTAVPTCSKAWSSFLGLISILIIENSSMEQEDRSIKYWKPARDHRFSPLMVSIRREGVVMACRILKHVVLARMFSVCKCGRVRFSCRNIYTRSSMTWNSQSRMFRHVFRICSTYSEAVALSINVCSRGEEVQIMGTMSPRFLNPRSHTWGSTTLSGGKHSSRFSRTGESPVETSSLGSKRHSW